MQSYSGGSKWHHQGKPYIDDCLNHKLQVKYIPLWVKGMDLYQPLHSCQGKKMFCVMSKITARRKALLGLWLHLSVHDSDHDGNGIVRIFMDLSWSYKPMTVETNVQTVVSTKMLVTPSSSDPQQNNYVFWSLDQVWSWHLCFKTHPSSEIVVVNNFPSCWPPCGHQVICAWSLSYLLMGSLGTRLVELVDAVMVSLVFMRWD